VLGWNERFAQGCNRVARATGHPVTLALAIGSVLAWAALGPMFGFSALWQLAINTGTTIVTFLMVFVIQNSQNRDTVALHLKIDELIRANDAARNSVLCIEDLTLEELDVLRERYVRLSKCGRDGVSPEKEHQG
jgi:low affinity Fe/Cu permease